MKENAGKGFGAIAREFGYSNLFTKGLGTRIFMIGTLTGLQWWIYDTFKTLMGFTTTGGKMECGCPQCVKTPTMITTTTTPTTPTSTVPPPARKH